VVKELKIGIYALIVAQIAFSEEISTVFQFFKTFIFLYKCFEILLAKLILIDFCELSIESFAHHSRIDMPARIPYNNIDIVERSDCESFIA
jgi:hypothetical protein